MKGVKALRQIIVRDSHGPEVNAMLQALYSRSPQSVLSHETHVEKVGPSKFMEQWLVFQINTIISTRY
jgi:hypothetical protein